jgi:very-short-patch-repair endonuclease
MRAPTVIFERARRLRRIMSLPEVLPWQALRGNRCAGLSFRRQHPIGPHILDFYCVEMMLAVQVDGAKHDLRRAGGTRRAA